MCVCKGRRVEGGIEYVEGLRSVGIRGRLMISAWVLWMS